MVRLRILVAALALAVLSGSLGSAQAATPLNLRIGWAVVPGQLTAVLFSRKDILKHYGKSYTVQTE